MPRSEYGRSKLRAEQIVQAQAVARGYQYTILRLATVYGPGAKTNGLFDQLVNRVARRDLLGRLNWPGRTSIVHVDDVAAIMVGVALDPGTASQIYCVANPEAPTIGALAEKVGRLVPNSPEPISLPPWVWTMSRAVVWNPIMRVLPVGRVLLWRLSLMVDDGFWFDTTKLQAIWATPMVGVDEGLAQMIASVADVTTRIAGV